MVELGDMGIGEQVLSVRQLTMVVSETIALIPAGLVVEGEVQKVRIYKEFMIFFELAGEGQSINCFTTFGDLKGELPEEGSKAQVLGEVSLGKKTELRFRVRELISAGQAGDNAKKLEELKIKLRAEGVFDESRKRSLPKFPKKVAVITSGGSSAWEDFKRISSSRFLAADIELFSSSVQGNLAVQEICSKLAEIEVRAQEFDVIAIVRGGGARGDLEAFNSEDIARMVMASSIPVVSGVGHEDDVSLVDLVADKRASTPSNAAEIIFPDSKDLFKLVESLRQKASIAMDSRLRFVELELASLKYSLSQSIYYYLGNLEAKLNLSKARLGSLDFEKLFAKGFAYLEHSGKPVVSVNDVNTCDLISAKLADGELELEVK